MNDSITKLFIFAAGAVLGAAATWKVVKTKYEIIADEEIESVKEVYEEKIEKLEEDIAILQDFSVMEDEDDEDDEVVDHEEIAKMATVVNSLGYANPVSKADISEYVNQKKEIKINEPVTENIFEKYSDKPYVISPDEFGDNEDYDTVTITYYEGDKFLADENNDLMEDVENSVGWDSLDAIGEYEDDAVHVRNDRLKIDYEILVMAENYSDTIPSDKPHQIVD